MIDFDDMNYYLRQIRGAESVTEDQRRDLCKKAQAGDSDARRVMVESNLGLVFKLAKALHTANEDLPFGDLMQEGIIGLIKAIDRFDTDMKIRFSTYTDFWIKRQMWRYMGSTGLIKVPDTLPRIKKILGANEYETPESISEKTGIKTEVVKDIIAADGEMIEIHRRIFDEGSFRTVEDEIPFNDLTPEEEYEEKINVAGLHAAVSSLPEQERRIIELRYLGTEEQPLPVDVRAAAKAMGITVSEAKRIEANAFEQIRRGSWGQDFCSNS
jgi:RNA polymerase primary sigma factor